MAHISEYSIVTYERKPGHWRAAISPNILDRSGAPGLTVPLASSRQMTARPSQSQLCNRTTDPETAKNVAPARATRGR
jgi:hypothetical protein